MATVQIQRERSFANFLKDYDVIVDDQPIGTVAHGETKSFEISPGKHSIKCKINWCYSPEMDLDLKEGNTESLKVEVVTSFSKLIFGSLGLTLILILGYYFLDFDGKTDYVPYFLFIPMWPTYVSSIYYFTIGRKKFLTLTKID